MWTFPTVLLGWDPTAGIELAILHPVIKGSVLSELLYRRCSVRFGLPSFPAPHCSNHSQEQPGMSYNPVAVLLIKVLLGNPLTVLSYTPSNPISSSHGQSACSNCTQTNNHWFNFLLLLKTLCSWCYCYFPLCLTLRHSLVPLLTESLSSTPNVLVRLWYFTHPFLPALFEVV